MKLFTFIKRSPSNDWLMIIRADSLEEAISLYDYKDTIYEVEEISQEKGCILAFHIIQGQARN